MATTCDNCGQAKNLFDLYYDEDDADFICSDCMRKSVLRWIAGIALVVICVAVIAITIY